MVGSGLEICISSPGALYKDQFTACPLARLLTTALKTVNYKKLQEIVQDRQENLTS